jgi:hypothetical protein
MPAMMASYPVLGHDLALHLHAPAELVGEVDLEALELAARAGEVPRLVGAFRGDLDGFPLLALREGATGRQRGGEDRDTNDFRDLHRHSPASKGWPKVKSRCSQLFEARRIDVMT